MNSRKHFILNVISYLILIIGILLNYWGISTLLFYFFIEIIVNCVVTAFYYRDNKKKKRTPALLIAGFGIGYFALGAIAILSRISGEFIPDPTIDKEFPVVFLIQIFPVAWPLILVRVGAALYEVKTTTREKLEEKAFTELVHNVLSIIGIMLLTLILIKTTHIVSIGWIIFSLITFRVLLDLYLYKSVLGWKRKEQTNP